jgi:transcriptional regulator with XRE-family HTH domain
VAVTERVAVLSSNSHDRRVSTGLDTLDATLGGLYRGENVVWLLDGASPEPFFRAIARFEDAFTARCSIALGGATYRDVAGMAVIEADPRSAFAQPADLLREVHRLSHRRGHQLLLFDSMDAMAQAWGPNRTRDFFARCCPMLLEFGATAYWSLTPRDSALQETVQAVAQVVLRVDERSVRVVKAEGRESSVGGTVLHWHQEGGRAVLAPAEIGGRVAASLRTVRRTRGLSQHDLGDLAGVTASAISQAERSERGLSLATIVRLSGALGVTIDDLLRGEGPGAYRIGRRGDDPEDGLVHTVPLIGGSELSIDLVHLGPRESGAPAAAPAGTGIVAVGSGLVQVQVDGAAPTVRHGEVLVADSGRIGGWRNLGQAEAELFWIVTRGSPSGSPASR